MELQSCFISDPEIVHTSKKVLIYAEEIAKEYNLLASDLILAAVWHCLNQANKTFSTDNQETCEKHHSDRISDINGDDKSLKNDEKYTKRQRSSGLDTSQQNLDNKSGYMLTKGTVECKVEVDDVCKEKNSHLPKYSDSGVDKKTKADIRFNERSSSSVSCQKNTNDLKNKNRNDRYSKTEENGSVKTLEENYKSNSKETDRREASEEENIRKSQVQGSSKQADDAPTTKQQASIMKEIGSHSKTETIKAREFATNVEVIIDDEEDSYNFCNGSKRVTIAHVETVVSKGKVEEIEPDYFDMDCDEIDDDAEYEEMLNTTNESARESSPRKQIKEDCDENLSLCVNDSDITIISDDEDDCKKNIENKESESAVIDQLSKQSTSSNKSPGRQERTPSKRKQEPVNIEMDFVDRSLRKEEDVVKDIAIKNVQVSKEQSSSKQISDRKASDSSELRCITAVLGLDSVSSTKPEDSSGPEMQPEQSHIPESQTESALPSPPESSSSPQCLDTVTSPPRKKRLLDYDKKWHMEPKYSPEQDKYLALPGGIDGNRVLQDWRQPGIYNSISQISSSQQSGFEKVYSDYINIQSVDDSSHVDDEQDVDDDTDYDVSKDDSFSNSSDEDSRRKHGRKSVTRGRPRGRPRLHGSKAIEGMSRGIIKETKHSRGFVRGVRGRPRGRTSLRGSLSNRGGTRTSNVSVKEFSSESDRNEKSSPKLTSFMRGLSFRSRGRKIGFYSLKFGKPRLTPDNALGSQGVVKRGPGRPRKHVLHSNMDSVRSSVGRDEPGTSSSADQPIKRGRGRPRSVRGVGTRGRTDSKPPEEMIRQEEELDVIIID